MALLFIDGFDHYVEADLNKKWSTGVGNITATGRRGGNALQNPSTLRKNIANTQTLIVGAAWKTNSLNDQAIFSFTESGTNQVDITSNTNGSISARRNGTVLGSSANSILTASTYYYIELKAKIDPSVGTIDVKVNGVSVLSLTGQNTRATSNSYADALTLSSNYYYDDLYLLDTTGSANNDFLGDCRVDLLLPNGAGNSTQLTPSTGSNYQCVDETAPNGDTDYVESSTAGQKDTYTYSDISHNPVSIFGVQILPCCEKTDAGARTVTAVTRSGGTDYDGATESPSASSYRYFPQIRETDPATSAAWTKTNLNAAEFGFKIVA